MFLISCFTHAYQYSIQQNHNLFHNNNFIPTHSNINVKHSHKLRAKKRIYTSLEPH